MAEETNNTTTIEPGSAAYNEQMAKAAEGVAINGDAASIGGDQASPDQTGDSGEKLLAGKFKTVEELEAAFAALSGGKTDEAEGNTEGTAEGETKNIDVDTASEEQVSDALKGVGLDFNEFTKEYDTSGELSEASYQKLVEAGIPKEMVDAYIEGQQAKANLIVERITSTVGGREAYEKMVKWAGANMTSDEIDAYNRVTSQGDPYTAQLAAEGLYRRYTAAVGTNNSFISGETSGRSTDIFESTAQVTAAMRDPRYRTDPAYRQQVAEKVARSNIF